MNIDQLVSRITAGVNDRISSQKVAYQFILEELDAASQGNDAFSDCPDKNFSSAI